MGDVGTTVAGAASGQGRYRVVFKVTQPCEDIYLNPDTIYPPVVESAIYLQDSAGLLRKMAEENASNEPLITLSDGQTLQLKNNLQFESYISDDDFGGYIKEKEYNGLEDDSLNDTTFKWWYVVIPVLILGICCATCLFCCLSYRRRKIYQEREQQMLDLQFQEAEKKGIEIPDDLKKVRTRIIKDNDFRKNQVDATCDELRQSQVRASIENLGELSNNKLINNRLFRTEPEQPASNRGKATKIE